MAENPFQKKWYSLIFPASVLASILLILVPLSPGMMDFLLSFNLTLSVLILLTTIFIRTPLEFNVFPSVLLCTTLFRLSLNIATTRLILTNAQEQGDLAAGHVVRVFSDFVAGGNVVVGLVLFMIMVLIQFVVITKGATRISEVSARFILDGLPGKQMAIDADLQSGTISAEEGQRRRMELSDQVDFYGAMDGASKFVRGDAIAGIIITLINILGGICIGISAGNLSLEETFALYTRLTIGDGLVSQIPAFLLAIAAGLLVTRSHRRKNLSEEVVTQLFSRPLALGMTALFLVLLAGTHLPRIPLILMGMVCLIVAWKLETNRKRKAIQETETEKERENERHKELKMSRMMILHSMELELGSGLTDWATEKDGETMLEEIRTVRETLAKELGFLLPQVHVTSAADLDATAYRIQVNGNPVAEYVLRLESLLAVEGEVLTGVPDGLRTVEPIRGTPAIWIADSEKERALELGYHVWKPQEVWKEHLTEVARQHAAELLSLEATHHLVEELQSLLPAVVKELIPDKISILKIHKVLRHLLAEQVSIRSLGMILETLAEHVTQTQNPAELADFVRVSLGRWLVLRNLAPDGSLHVLTLSPTWEEKIQQTVEWTSEEVQCSLMPEDSERLERLCEREFTTAQLMGIPVVLLVSPSIRSAVRQILESKLPRLPVLSFQEIPRETSVQSQKMLEWEK